MSTCTAVIKIVSTKQNGSVYYCCYEQKTTSLRILDLEMNGLGVAGAVSVANLLKANVSLEELDISSNRITDQGAFAIGKALEVNQTLRKLNVISAL